MIGRRPDSSPRSPFSRWAQAVSDPGHLTLDVVVAYVDGELAQPSAHRATSHVARCLSCAAEVAAQSQARRRLRGAEAPDVPSTLMSSLRAIPDTAIPDTAAPDAAAPDTAVPDPLADGVVPDWPAPPAASPRVPPADGPQRRWGGRSR